jgi:hypothetical protein
MERADERGVRRHLLARDMTLPTPSRGERIRLWLRRVGVAGFAFFALKGILWLIVPAILAWAGCRG